MEERGIPAVALVGTPFLPMAVARLASLDFPDARMVEFEHPINSLDEAEVHVRGQRIVADVLKAFLE